MLFRGRSLCFPLVRFEWRVYKILLGKIWLGVGGLELGVECCALCLPTTVVCSASLTWGFTHNLHLATNYI